MFTELRNLILDNWNQFEIGKKPDDLSFIRRSSTWADESGKIVFFVFRKGAHKPSLIVKTVKSNKFGNTIAREAENLFYLWENTSDDFKQTFPRPLLLNKEKGIPVYFEQAVDGVTYTEIIRKAIFKKRQYHLLNDMISFSVEWLIKFIDEIGYQSKKISENEIDELVLCHLNQILELNNSDENLKQFLNSVEHDIKELAGCEIPFVPGHGDFWGGSLLWDKKEKLRVIDWEFLKKNDFPLFDVFMLIIHPGVTLNSKKCDAITEFSMCFEDSKYSINVRQSILKLSKQLKIDDELIQVLFKMFLVRMIIERDAILKNSESETGRDWSYRLKYFIQHQHELKILP